MQEENNQNWGGGEERVFPERGQTLFQRAPNHTHPRYCDTAIMCTARTTQTHRISVSLSMSPGAEPIGARQSVADCVVICITKGSLFYLLCFLCARLHITSISDSGPMWHLPFVFLLFLAARCLPLAYSFSLAHTVCPLRLINGRTPSPSTSSVENCLRSLQQCPLICFSLLLCARWCVYYIFLATKSH